MLNPALTSDSQVMTFTLSDGFTFFSTKPNVLPDANAAKQFECTHFPASVPGTVAGHIADAQMQAQLDQLDHWYHLEFARPQTDAQRWLLQFDGLLTQAEAYLNGERILESISAYHAHEIDVTHQLENINQLWICFRAVQPLYSAKQPRGRYMTRLINERHLRFMRTPVLGYTPGFSSPVKPAGPFRPIRFVGVLRFQLTDKQVHTHLAGKDIGHIDLNVTLQVWGDLPQSAALVLYHDTDGMEVARHALKLQHHHSQLLTLQIECVQTVDAYWPHTHGAPRRYRLQVEFDTGEQLVLGDYGFRRIERASGRDFVLHYNGKPIFYRGACWTPIDPLRLYSKATALRQRLTLLRDAGFNMLRIPGNMLYESDDFYALCDELGLLVFQDFAFSNFDYPETDDFFASVEKEVSQFLQKHAWRPCMTALCGGSEVAQQAAMMGLPLTQVDHTLFTEQLPMLIAQHAPHLPYAISSPYASQQLPFHVGDGPNTYFGVGGYLRSFEDARLHKGRFITECLPFSHVPEEHSLRQFWGGEIPTSHHPLWKEGVARDPGSGWDFSDVTDFYMHQLFGVDPVRTRSISPERYLAYCRATVAATVETTMSIFRADSSTGRAALVWLLHDLKPGAGWGYIDTLGQPKSAFYALARVFQPTTVLFVDEGLEGLAVYVAHDSAKPLQATLHISLIDDEGKVFAQADAPLTLNPRALQRFSVDTLIGHFVDSSYAYRFGPRAFVACVARLIDSHGVLLSQRVHAATTEMNTLCNDAGLQVQVVARGDETYMLTVSCEAPAYFVALELPDFQLSHNYFHVMPNFPQPIHIKANSASPSLQGRLRALNVKSSTAIRLASGT